MEGPAENCPSSHSFEEFQKNETLNIRSQLADLNCKDLRQYFRGFRSIYNKLETKKEELEVEEIVYREELKSKRQDVEDINNALSQLKMMVKSKKNNVGNARKKILEEISTMNPELAISMEKLTEKQRQLAYLKFVQNFSNIRDEVRASLRTRNFRQLQNQYTELIKIPDKAEEFSNMSETEYAVKIESLDRFLAEELRHCLLESYSRIRFPFEDAVDYKSLQTRLDTTVEIMKCLHLVHSNTDSYSNLSVLEIVLDEFGKRFNYHFYGDKPTNSVSKPEWFFTQISVWICNNLEYFEVFVQKYMNETDQTAINAKEEFIYYLVKLASKKVKSLVHQNNFLQDRRLLSHLIDEAVIFEKEMHDTYDYSEDEPVHVISELCQESVLDTWFKLERDTISIGIDSILADPDAYESRYKGAADVDMYFVPNFADSFVILMQSMFERYNSIPNIRLQCRFTKLQLIIVDEFRSRIVQINQQIDTPWRKPYPQLMNSLWYLTLVLDDWSDMPEFVRLQYFLQSSSSSLVRGIFDESAALYRHVWRQRAKHLSDSFSEHIKVKLGPYSKEKWFANDSLKVVDVLPSFAHFLTEINRLITWINENISPDSILTIYHLVNHEVWQVIHSNVISRTSFNCRQAAQMLFDITTALIPLLNSLFGRPKSAGEFDAILNDKCINVLNTLKLLSMPVPTAILLKDEMRHIPEQMLEAKLDPFNISADGLTRERILEIFEQRCDMVI